MLAREPVDESLRSMRWSVRQPSALVPTPCSLSWLVAGKRWQERLKRTKTRATLGEREIARKKPGKNDVVVGIAASGRTPFTIAAVQYARRQGAQTVAVTCNRKSPLQKAADLAIVTEVGPEVVSGSTRMKAGTAQKMVLNMLSTGAMVRLGFVYGNLMVNVRPRNKKLAERTVSIVETGSKLQETDARRALRKSGNSVAVALVMLKAKVNRGQAQRALRSALGNVRRAIALASQP